ncbi:putative ribonuclease H-like domain-containing protein [Tanacetum coccineum]|uniref:Ribonuclease H-like domain-containing protein n=1 Tax=Tanacetum coccineum TaxID=301880 RepID=A0ABQ4WMS0_9ASTR
MTQLKYCDKHNQVGFLRKPDKSVGFAEIVDFLRGSNLKYALTTNLTIHDSLVKQFWQTATAKTLADGTLELHATIDTIAYTITEASIRSKLKLADASGITMLLNNEIFEGMGHMGDFRGAPRPLLLAMLSIVAPSTGKEAPSVTQPQPSSSVVPPTPPTTQPIPSEATPIPPLSQPVPPTPIAETTNASLSPTPSPAHELMEHTFEQPSSDRQPHTPRQEATTSQVKTLEVALKRKTKRILLSDSEEEEIEAQGRKFHDLDSLVSLLQELVTPSKTVNASGEEQVEDIIPTTLEAAAILTKVKKIKSVNKGNRYKRRKSSKESAGTGLDFEEVKSAFEEVNTGGLKVSAGIEEINAGSLDVNTGIDPVTNDSIRVSIPSPDRGKREGKAPMIEEEETQASRKTKEQILQEEVGLAEAIRLDALEKAMEKERIWPNIRLFGFNSSSKSKLEANAELKKSVLGNDLTVKDYAKRMVELLISIDEVGIFEDSKEDFGKIGLPTVPYELLKLTKEQERMISEDSDEANEKMILSSGQQRINFVGDSYDACKYIKLHGGRKPDRIVISFWKMMEKKAGVYKVEKALYGLHQAPRAWYETLSTYLLDNGFYKGQIDKTLFIKRVNGDILLVQVYVDDIIFGSTKKSLCTDFKQIMHKMFQIGSIGELTFFLGLQVKQKEDEIFISRDKYVGEILKKFGFSSIRTANTPMEINKSLRKDKDGEDVDIHLYRSMIQSLMYLTSSRPDITFLVCACSRFQVHPKVSHLNAVKRIFRYLKGQPKLGLWYPRDSPFILEAFSDSDNAGASLDRKSITGGCQFLGSRLIS